MRMRVEARHRRSVFKVPKQQKTPLKERVQSPQHIWSAHEEPGGRTRISRNAESPSPQEWRRPKSPDTRGPGCSLTHASELERTCVGPMTHVREPAGGTNARPAGNGAACVR
jgi:hypothetical protein